MDLFLKNLDLLIISVFLLINLALGVSSGLGIKNIKEYAIGNRNFSTAALAATIIATWIDGSFFAVSISESYKEGLWFVAAGAGSALTLLIVAYVFGPRMKEFFGQLSVAEMMGTLYGRHVRIITAVASIAQAVGITALQIKIFSVISAHFLGIHGIYAVVSASVIVVTYSAFGGIKSVTFTDKIQFFTFGVVLPLFALLLWKILGTPDIVGKALNNDTVTILNYKELGNIGSTKFWPHLFLFLYCVIPGLNPTTVQRTLMASSTAQIRTAFSVAAAICMLIHLCTSFIGVVTLTANPGLDPSNVATYIVEHYATEGVKGLVLMSIIAMVMSTTDSWINSAAVIFTHDFCKPLGMKLKHELAVSRLFAVSIGTASIFIALTSTNLLHMELLSASLYMPIVSVPLIFAILGFRSTTKTVLLAMLSGSIVVALWIIGDVQSTIGIDAVIPGMLTNLIILFLSHYIMRQPGGWVGTKDDSDLKKIREERAERNKTFCKFISNLPDSFRSFNFASYCMKFTPKNEVSYIYFAIGAFVSTILMGLANHDSISEYSNKVILSLHFISLLAATVFLCNRLWNETLRTKYIGLIWYVSIFATLSYASSTFVLFCHFSNISVIIFILNMVMVAMLLNSRLAIAMTFLSMLAALITFLISGETFEIATSGSQMELLFIFVLFTGFAIGFIKPKEEALSVAEAKASHLWEKVRDMDKEVHKAEFLKTEFLNNISHEVRTPMTGITSLGQILWENYDNIPEDKRKDYVKTIAQSSDRLITLMNNILDLSSLTSLKLEVHLETANLGELAKERLKHCQKIYLDDKKLDFEIECDNNAYISCDMYHMSHTIDNLIMNAIAYSKPGTTIRIRVKRISGQSEFSIRDEGIGIPVSELYDVFRPFTVSSKTRTPSGGRGVGLALCFAVLTAHNGKIWAESDGASWAEFKFKLG